MYNAQNPIHYIALHNEAEVLPMLINNYRMPMPANHNEYFSMIDYATNQFGDHFIDSMIKVHPDRHLFAQKSNFVADDYVLRVKQYTLPQLTAELETLTQTLKNTTDDKSKVDVLDTIAFVQKLIIEKQKERPLPATAPTETHKTTQNHYLLVFIAALALMYLGSKIFKQ